MALKPGYTYEGIAAELQKALDNPDIIPPIKDAIRATMMNGTVEYPKDFDPNGWDPVVEGEEKWEIEREERALGKDWLSKFIKKT